MPLRWTAEEIESVTAMAQTPGSHPDCQGVARFDTEEQARYVAKGHTAEFDTVFVAVEHDGHYHVIDTGWGEDD